MAQIPKCPNHVERRIGDHGLVCVRSELVLLGENQQAYRFWCRNCHLDWWVTKDKTKAQARAANQAKKVQELNARERAGIRAKFYAPKKGWTVPV